MATIKAGDTEPSVDTGVSRSPRPSMRAVVPAVPRGRGFGIVVLVVAAVGTPVVLVDGP